MSDLSLLMDMGFPQEKAERALSVTGNQGVEQAMEWLLAHGDEMDTTPQESSGAVGDPAPDTPEKVADKPEMEDSEAKTTQDLGDEASVLAKSLKCDECNKKFRTDAEVEFHAVKTGHQSFSESSEEIVPLTEEEKKEQLKKLEVIIKQRRAEKAEQEKREELEREKSRRKTGQEITGLRQKMQEDEMKQLAELKRKEKLEAKQARQRVLEQIERDKQARREKFGMPGATSPAPAAPAPQVAAPATPMSYDECNIQVRMMNGSCLTQKFSPNEQLAAVRLFVQMHRSESDGPFNLMTNFPKKVFTENDMETPLSALGLVPSAVLIVCKPQ